MPRLAGKHYLAAGLESEGVAALIEEASLHHGFEVQKTTDDPRLILLRSTRRASWPHVLLGVLVQRADWHISPGATPKESLLIYHRRWFDWYRAMVIVGALPVGWLWFSGFASISKTFNSQSFSSLQPLYLPWAGIIGMILYASLLLPSYDSVRYIGSIRDLLHKSHVSLDALPNKRGDRTTVSVLAFLAYVLCATAPLLMYVGDPGRVTRAPVFLIVLLVCVPLGLITLFLFRGLHIGFQRVGADDRFAAVAPSMNIMMAVLFYLAGQLCLKFFYATSPSSWDNAFELQGVLSSGMISERDLQTSWGEATASLQQRRLAIGMILSLGFAFLLASFFFLIRSIRVASLSRDICHRIGTGVSSPLARASASGQGFLRPFVRVYSWSWYLYGMLFYFGATSFLEIARMASSYMPGDLPSQGGPYYIKTAIEAVALFSGQNRDAPDVTFLVRAGLIVWGCTVPVLVTVSMADLACRRIRRELRSRNGRCIALKNSFDKSLLGKQQWRVMVTDQPGIHASVHATLFRRKTVIVEVSQQTVDLLELKELHAIIGHELGHHVCGHTRKLAAMEWLGRFTLVGDTFVGALMDSFGYEMEADGAAIAQLQVSPVHLRQALLRMQVALMLEKNKPSGLAKKSAAVERWGDDSQRTASLYSAIRQAIANWADVYRGDPPIAYWHPTVQERISMLSQLEKCEPTRAALREIQDDHE